MKIITAHQYVSPRARPLTPEEKEVRRIAYALKVPTQEAAEIAARDLCPLLDAAEAPQTVIVLMPVPASTGSIEANRYLAACIAHHMRQAYPARAPMRVRPTVGRMHPVESSCQRRRHGLPGLRGSDHALIRVAGPLVTTAAYYFVDNVAATGATLTACREALGFGDAIVWADEGKVQS